MLLSDSHSRALFISRPLPRVTVGIALVGFSRAYALHFTSASLSFYTVLSWILRSHWSGALVTTLVDIDKTKLSGSSVVCIHECSLLTIAHCCRAHVGQ